MVKNQSMMSTDRGMPSSRPTKYSAKTNRSELSVTALCSPKRSRNPIWRQYSRKIPHCQNTRSRTGSRTGSVAANCHARAEVNSESNRSANAVRYASTTRMQCVATLTHGRRRETCSCRLSVIEVEDSNAPPHRSPPWRTSTTNIGVTAQQRAVNFEAPSVDHVKYANSGVVAARSVLDPPTNVNVG